jgi:hypothetical protein
MKLEEQDRRLTAVEDDLKKMAPATPMEADQEAAN